MARIVAVCASQRRSDPKLEMGAGELVAGFGLVGDAHAGLSEREVSLLGIESVREANEKHGILALPGSFAENLTTEGLDLPALALGDRLQVGKQALLEVVQIGKPPSDSHTYSYHGVSILPHKGVFCRVLRGGRVARGDEITVIPRGGLRVLCLTDNAVGPGTPFWGEHGLSFLIETPSGCLLLDTGASGTVLLHNLEAAQVRLEKLSALVLSHGHLDHTGGLAALLGACPALPVFAHPAVAEARYSRRGETLREIGTPPEAADALVRASLRLSREPQQVAPGVWTSGEITTRNEPEGRAAGHVVRRQDQLVPDPYLDDLSLVLQGREGLALVCGCCHAGLLNTLEHVRATFGAHPRLVAGGTHLVASDAAGIAHVVERLDELGIAMLYPNHCTGQAAYVALAVALGERVKPCPAGTLIEI